MADDRLNQEQMLATGIAALPPEVREVTLPFVLGMARVAAASIKDAPAAHRNTLMLAHMAELVRTLQGGDVRLETVQ